MLKKIWVAVVFSVFLQGVSFAGNSTHDDNTLLLLSQNENRQTDDYHALLQKAQQGDAQAQYNLGVMYLKGEEVPQNDKEAVKWFQAAAKRGVVEAQYNLGLMYQKGKGVSQSDKEAAKWFQAAAKQGNAEAQLILGMMYHEGVVVQKNVQEARRLWKLSCQQGLQSACKILKEIN